MQTKSLPRSSRDLAKEYLFIHESMLPESQWGGEDFERRSKQYEDRLDEFLDLYQNKLMSFFEMGQATGVDWWVIRNLFDQNNIRIYSKEEIYKLRRDRDFPILYIFILIKV